MDILLIKRRPVNQVHPSPRNFLQLQFCVQTILLVCVKYQVDTPAKYNLYVKISSGQRV